MYATYAKGDLNDREELRSVPVEGGVSPTPLVGPAPDIFGASDFKISPDGVEAIYVMSDGSATSQLLAVPVSGGASRAVTPVLTGTFPTRPVLSPDGQRVVYSSSVYDTTGLGLGAYLGERLSVVGISGGTPTFLTGIFDPLTTYLGEYAISGDGTRVLYTTNDEDPFVSTLWSVPIAGGTPSTLSSSAGDFLDFEVSPVGDQVVFHRYDPGFATRELFSVSGGPGPGLYVVDTAAPPAPDPGPDPDPGPVDPGPADPPPADPGGAGDPAEVVTCRGLVATIVGTAGADRLVGTAGADVIAGLDGDDTIFGLGGDDIICACPGADRVAGGTGNDRIYGEGGPGLDTAKNCE